MKGAFHQTQNILVITGSTTIPVLVADRLLKHGYQMMQVREASDVLKLPDEKDYFGLGIVTIDGEIGDDELQNIINGTGRVYPNLEFIIVREPGGNASQLDLGLLRVIDEISFPFEAEILVSRIFESVPIEIPANRLTLDAVTQIHLPPIEALDTLPFDVFIFLPLNNRAILYKKAGQRGFQEGLEKITVKKNSPIYIRRSDFHIYSKYLAQYVSSAADESDLPKTVQLQVMQKRFTSIMRSFFSASSEMEPEAAQAMLDSVRKIATEFASANSDNSLMYERIQLLIGRSISNYAHAMNVSAYSTIFGIMAGFTDTDSLSLGGLFHDIGLSELPPELSLKEYEDLETDDERDQYLTHGRIGVELIEKRNIPLSYEVRNMIEQHHYISIEGGRNMIDQVHPFAEICAFADVFDNLTSVRSGQKVCSPFEAIQKIIGMDAEDGQPMPVYNADVHDDIVQTFLLDALDNEDLLEMAAEEIGDQDVVSKMMEESED